MSGTDLAYGETRRPLQSSAQPPPPTTMALSQRLQYNPARADFSGLKWCARALPDYPVYQPPPTNAEYRPPAAEVSQLSACVDLDAVWPEGGVVMSLKSERVYDARPPDIRREPWSQQRAWMMLCLSPSPLRT
eukprot:2620932-Rhodomonas_salina.3